MKICIALLFTMFAHSSVAGEWLNADLNQIEAAAGSIEGIYFAKPAPYVTTYTCVKNRYIVIKEQKLADRTLSLALYAKSTGIRLRIYVEGCDALGHLNGTQVMLETPA